MRLIELQLENFRQYERAVVPFENGITAIVGVNGAGKTTLIEAIAWALYGADAKRGDNLSLRWLWSPGGAKVRVLLTFELGNHLYQVQRTLQSAHLSLRDGAEWRITTTGLGPVTAKAEELLGMNLRQFQTSFYARQKEIEFMAYEKERRREEISRMLGYERVTESIEQVRQDLTALRREVEGLEAGLGDPKTLQEQIAQLRKHLKEQQRAVEKAEAEYRKAQEALEAVEPRKREMEELQRTHQNLSTRLSVLQTEETALNTRLDEARQRWDALQADHERFQEIRPQAEAYQETQKQLKKLDALAQHEHERIQLQSQIEHLQKQIETLEGQQAELQKKKERLEELQPTLQEYARLQTYQRELRERAKQAAERPRLRALLEQNQERLQQLEDQGRQLGDPATQMAALQKQVAELQENLQTKETEYNHLRDEWNQQKTTLENRQKAIQGERLKLDQRLQELQSLGEAGKCPTCEQPLGAHLQRVIARYQEQVKELDEDLKSTATLLESLPEEPPALKVLQATMTQIRQQILQLERQSTQHQIALEQQKRVLGEIETLRQTIGRLREELARLPEYDPEEETRVLQQLEALKLPYEEATTLQHDLQGLPTLEKNLKQGHTSLESLQKRLQALPTGYDEDEHQRVRREWESLRPLYEEALQLHARLKEKPALKAHIQKLRDERKTKQEERKQVEQQIKTLGYSESAYQKVLGEYERCQQELTAAGNTLHRLQAEHRSNQSLLSNLETQYEEYQKRAALLKEKQGELLLKETLYRALQAFRVDLNARLRPLLADYAGEFLSQMTGGRYTQLEIDEGYNFHLLEDGVPKTVISGGEGDVVNLSLRLALARLIAERAGQPLSLLILDEVFGSLDTERRQNVLEVLRGLRDWFQQILVISHIEEINEAADRCLWVLRDERTRCSRIVERAPVEGAPEGTDTALVAMAGETEEALGGLFG